MKVKTPMKDPELWPDAWARFERAMDAVMKAPPMHRTKAAKPVAPRKSKQRPKKKPVKE
jgi:hypothetical protein